MKAKTTLVSSRGPSFGQIINSGSMRSMIDKTLGDQARATRFVSTLVAAVSDSEQLAACDPKSVISSALKGEALGLNLALQGFHLLPFGNQCTFIIGYKGYIQLALRTGLYEDLDAMEIREGEYKGKNPRTGQPMLQFIEDDDERETKPIIGYYAFIQLKDGFFKSIYWSKQKMLEHANRYSAAFSLQTYNKYINKESLTDKERRQVENGPWYDTNGSQIAMGKKTVLRQLLNSGFAPLSIEMQNLMAEDDKNEAGGESIANALVNPEVAETHDVDPETGEVVDVEYDEVEVVPAPEPVEAPKTAPRQRKAPTPAEPSKPAQPAQYVSAYGSFFED